MDTNEFLESLLEDSEQKAENLDDKGHLSLVDDLEELLEKAKKGIYHDFHRNGDAAPKILLVTELDELRQHVIDGKYDN